MTWGPMFMYYRCPLCGLKYKYELGRMSEFGAQFAFCPDCHVMGTFEKEGARTPDDADYHEVDE